MNTKPSDRKRCAPIDRMPPYLPQWDAGQREYSNPNPRLGGSHTKPKPQSDELGVRDEHEG